MNTENTLLPSVLQRLQQFLSSHNANPLNQLPNWLKHYFTNNQFVQRNKRGDKGHVYLIGAGPGVPDVPAASMAATRFSDTWSADHIGNTFFCT